MTRSKPYRPRLSGARTLRTQPWKLNAVFQPIESILRQMESTGHSSVDMRGRPIFQSLSDADWYTSSDAIHGVADAYEAHALRSGREMPTGVLRRIANKLHYGAIIFVSDVAEMRVALAVLRSETARMTEGYAASLLQTVQIQIEVKKIGVAA